MGTQALLVQTCKSVLIPGGCRTRIRMHAAVQNSLLLRSIGASHELRMEHSTLELHTQVCTQSLSGHGYLLHS